jgi:WD40 repeat protein
MVCRVNHRHRLAVDFGTSTTVAMLADPDGRVRPLLFDASPLLSSAVFAAGDGLLVGPDAERAAAAFPAGLEPNPKRRIDDGTVWIGGRVVAVVDLVAAVLARTAEEAARVLGHRPASVILTHPATWGGARTGVLRRAAARAGLTDVTFVPEPVAAAAYFAVTRRLSPGGGRHVLVYDLGAGTFDVSVVRRTDAGFEVVAADGLTDVGGLDLDAAVVRHARDLTRHAGVAWQRLDAPRDTVERQARSALWRGARAAKEHLSRHPVADLHIPIAGIDVHITREEFEAAARPYLERTVALTAAVLDGAGVARTDVAGLFLVGGSSRVPLVGTLLHHTLGIGPTALDQPELVVAEGSLREPAPVPSPRPPLPDGAVPPARRPRRRHRRAVAAVLAFVLLAATATGAALRPWQQAPQGTWHTGVAASAVSATPPSARSARALGDGFGSTDRSVVTNVNDLAFSADGTLVATVIDSTVQLWNTATRSAAGDPMRFASFVVGIAFSPDGNLLAVITDEGAKVRFYGVTTRKQTGAALSNPVDATITRLEFTARGSVLATFDSLGNVRFWDVATRRQTGAAVEAGSGDITNAILSPDGATLATSVYGSIQFWDVATRTRLGQPLIAPGGDVVELAFSPDGRILAAAAFSDNTVRLWDVGTRALRDHDLRGHTGWINGIIFTPDSRVVITGSTDHSVRLWDAGTGAPIGEPLVAHISEVQCLAISPDGTTFATGDLSGWTRLWQLVT